MKKEEARQKIEKAGKKWEDFIEWMAGQTIGGTPNDPNYYEGDIIRFLENKEVVD